MLISLTKKVKKQQYIIALTIFAARLTHTQTGCALVQIPRGGGYRGRVLCVCRNGGEDGHIQMAALSINVERGITINRFKLAPSKGFNITVSSNGSVTYWYDLFCTLMKADCFAPMLIVVGYLDLVLDVDCPWIATPYAQKYAWIGELMADAEREEISDAADATGLFVKGINDFVMFALSNDERKHKYAPAVKEILANKYYNGLLKSSVTVFCMQELS